MIERDEDGWPKPLGGVDLEPVTRRVGWAVFTGCEGETVNFHAFFAWREDAVRYVCSDAAKDADGDAYLLDPGIAPALISDGQIIAANHYDDVLCAGAVLLGAGIFGEEADRYLVEAAEPRSTKGRGGPC